MDVALIPRCEVSKAALRIPPDVCQPLADVKELQISDTWHL